MNKEIKVQLIGLFFILSFSPYSFAAVLSLDKGPVSLDTSEVTLLVNLTSQQEEGISALSFEINYDSAELSFKKVVSGQTAIDSQKAISSSVVPSGAVRLVIFGLNKNIIGNGTVAHLTFGLRQPPAVQELSFSISNAKAANSQAEEVSLSTLGAVIVFPKATEPSSVAAVSPASPIEETKIASAIKTEEKKTEQIQPSLVYVQPVLIEQETAEEPEEQLETYAEKKPDKPEIETSISAPSTFFPPSSLAESQASLERFPEYIEEEADESTHGKIPLLTKEEKLPAQKQDSKLAQGIKSQVLPVKVNELKRFLFWRVYQLQLEEKKVQPAFWNLQGGQRLPFLLRLNKTKGTIYGIVWGKQTVQLNLSIITQDGQNIEASCALGIF